MDGTIFVISASTLIDGIHEIKRWFYNGKLRVLLCASTLRELEERYEASLVVKEQPKDAAPKKISGRLARREQPLFDINPRTAWEFVSRAKAWSKDGGVVFQAEGEEFTQWKEEEEAQRAKALQVAPTSFLEALQTKTGNQISSDNFNKGLPRSPSQKPKLIDSGPGKAKLISRMNEPKSPWKLQHVPKIESTGVPQDLRPLFGCVLWRLYEADPNPLEPARYAVLADDLRVKSVADRLRISSHTRAEIRKIFSIRAQTADHRETSGQLEKDFPNAAKLSTPHASLTEPKLEKSDLPTRAAERATASHDLAEATISNGSAVTNTPKQGIRCDPSPVQNGANPLDTLLESLTQTTFPADETLKPKFSPFQTLAESIDANSILRGRNSPPASNLAIQKIEEQRGLEPDSDSEEEDVIVFNPRARRISGRPQTPAKAVDVSWSRPGTSEGLGSAFNEPAKAARSPIFSTLKPQSPVFTPGQLYIPVADVAPTSASPPAHPNGIYPTPRKTPPRSPEKNMAKISQTKSQPASPHSRGHANGQAQRQQSEMIIKRQREAIQRQAKTAPKPPPRQVQMEPTDNPTIIDPDAFDRSYVVQPLSQTPEKASGRRNGGGRSRGNPRDSTRSRGKSGSDPSDDFVLKSGTPRSATRGKGKLWVP